jgi:hypothetical protein
MNILLTFKKIIDTRTQIPGPLPPPTLYVLPYEIIIIFLICVIVLILSCFIVICSYSGMEVLITDNSVRF